VHGGSRSERNVAFKHLAISKSLPCAGGFFGFLNWEPAMVRHSLRRGRATALPESEY
jgi:hypothetical protein